MKNINIAHMDITKYHRKRAHTLEWCHLNFLLESIHGTVTRTYQNKTDI